MTGVFGGPVEWRASGRSYGKLVDLLDAVQGRLIVDGVASVVTEDAVIALRLVDGRIQADVSERPLQGQGAGLVGVVVDEVDGYWEDDEIEEIE